MKVMKHKYKKPNCVGDINSTFSLGGKPPQPHEVLVIGDRITADIIMGNSGGFLTIRTQPFCTKNENFFVTSSRWFEDNILLNLSRTKNKFEKFEELKRNNVFEEFICPQTSRYL
uniref:Uncharacterized protein n=1 Tax=Euplotes harpa TaxID=151035 RepID=A0A7S3JMZ7_9SPIT|mmetsp:Transcript_6411/g.7372  ORF Transcript_6411/g.7372 Transcript_6411/m.7372 type:complete len:115 (+) Transcript_6411:386-730(+)